MVNSEQLYQNKCLNGLLTLTVNHTKWGFFVTLLCCSGGSGGGGDCGSGRRASRLDYALLR